MFQSKSKSSEHDVDNQTNQMYIDEYGRPVDYLRISLTQRCNLSCFFCHHEGEIDSETEMKYEGIERIILHSTKHGIHHLKLTGGEPLLRKDIRKIVKMISPLIEDLSMTTNGVYLEDMAFDLKTAGLSRVNISLHSLDNETYRRITGTDNLERVKRGIKSAVEVGLNPVKLNMTILRGYNESEIRNMMEFAAEMGCVLQLIELQQMHDSPDITDLHVDLNSIENKFAEIAIQRRYHQHNGRYQYLVPLDNGKEVAIEVVKSMHNPEFCRNCTRLRVTSDGKLKPCLLRNDNLVEISDLKKVQPNSEPLDRAFSRAVKNRKPYWREEHHE